MVLATRPRQEDIKHYLPDSADVSVVRGDRSLRLRTICATREEAERTFLLFTFTYGLGAGGGAPPAPVAGGGGRFSRQGVPVVPFFTGLVAAMFFFAGRGGAGGAP